MHLAKYSQLHRLPIPSHEMIGVICLTFTTKKAQVRVILGVAQWKIIVGQLLFCGEGIIQCLFNFFLFITSEKHEIIATAKASSSESESWGATPAYAHHAILPSPNFFPWVLSYPSPQSEREKERERERQTVRRENLGTRLAQSLYDACPGLLGQCISVRHPRRTAGTLLDLATRKA